MCHGSCTCVCMDHSKCHSWVSVPEGDKCMCTALRNLASKVLLNCHWCVPDMFHVSCDYSACLHYQHSVGLPSVVIALAFHDHCMHPMISRFPPDATVDPAEKNVESLQVSLFWVHGLALILRFCNIHHLY